MDSQIVLYLGGLGKKGVKPLDGIAVQVALIVEKTGGQTRQFHGAVRPWLKLHLAVVPVNLAVGRLIAVGQRPPAEFTRPEVADLLIEWAKNA